MQIEFLNSNFNNASVLIPAILQEWHTYYESKAFGQYYPEKHKVNLKEYRQPKEIQVPDYSVSARPDGTQPTKSKYVDLNRISLALQKLIVSRKTAFVTGGAVNIKSKPENEIEQRLYDLVLSTWKANKLQYRNSDIFKRMASETECAEIWYSEKDGPNVKMRMNIYSPSMGFDLIPIFDNVRNLISFGLQYQVKELETTYQRIDIYDDMKIRKYSNKSGTWVLIEELNHNYTKIPVMYYGIISPVWSDVQNMIERLEVLMSNFADTNDYNGSPILFAEGDIKGWSEKGETGKVIQGENGAKLSYVDWDSAPEAIRMEIDKLLDFIFTITQTPNISFAEMKGLGDISGAAWDRLMIDAHLNAMDYHNGVYGEGIQRRLNFLKTALSKINTDLSNADSLDITPVFSLFKLDSDSDRIDTALKANGNKPVMSQEESISYVGISDDVKLTIEQIKSEENQP